MYLSEEKMQYGEYDTRLDARDTVEMQRTGLGHVILRSYDKVAEVEDLLQ